MTIYNRTIGTTQVRLCGRNLARTSLVVQNNHATANVYISDASEVDTGSIRIRAGASISFKIPEDDPTEDFWVLSDTASTNISVYEGFGRPEFR